MMPLANTSITYYDWDCSAEDNVDADVTSSSGQDWVNTIIRITENFNITFHGKPNDNACSALRRFRNNIIDAVASRSDALFEDLIIAGKIERKQDGIIEEKHSQWLSGGPTDEDYMPSTIESSSYFA